MTGLYAPSLDGSGTYVKTTKGLWVADDTGTYRPARNAWASKDDGSFAKIWPYTVAINTFTGAPAVPSYSALTLNWDVSNADHIEIRYVGGTTVIFTGTSTTGSVTFTDCQPGYRYGFTLRVVGPDGSYTDSAPLYVTLSQLPAPANLRQTSLAYNSIGLAWNPVDGVDNYQVIDTLASGGPVKAQVAAPATTYVNTGLVAATTYERAVRATLNGAQSANSNKLRFTTPAAPGSAPGTYEFAANYAEAWAPGTQTWRGASNGILHGDGDNFFAGSRFGYQVTMFFYDLAAIRALSGRVTRFKIRIKRDSTVGYSSPQNNHFLVHTAATRPAGNPANYLGYNLDSGSLAWGQEGAFDLPVAWGQSLIDNYANVAGIAWGYCPARFMRGPSLASYPNQGRLYITIG